MKTASEKAVLKLAAHLLAEYGSELSNNTCNDLEPEVVKMIKEIGKDESQKIADDWNGGECEGGLDCDWITAKAIGNKLRQMAEE